MTYVVVILIIGIFMAALAWLARPLPHTTSATTPPPPAVDYTQYAISLPDQVIPCQPWDSGDGTVGYSWHVPQPRALILLQHGYADYALRFVNEHHQLIPRLVAQGFSVYAMDLVGHGHAAGTRGVLDIRTAVQQHIQARSALSTHGLPLICMGHSLGGFIGVASALQHPHDLAGVVLLSPALPPAFPSIAQSLANILARLWPTASAPLPAAPESGLARDTVYIQRATDDPLIYHAGITNLVAATALAVNANRLNMPTSTWHYPTLAQHGDADSWASIRGSQDFIASIPAHDKQLLVYPDGRHNLLCDHGAEQVWADLSHWLDARWPHKNTPTA